MAQMETMMTQMSTEKQQKGFGRTDAQTVLSYRRCVIPSSSVSSVLTAFVFCFLGCSGKESGGTVAGDSSSSQSTALASPTTKPIDPTLWLTSTPGHAADFGSAMSRARLVERFGAANVVEDSVQNADAPAVPGTVLFPKDSTRRLEIIWADPKTRTRPERVDLRGESGRWAVDPGIRLGMRLTDLERINGGPFTVTGFDWDYGGTITNWRGGKLARPASETPRIFIQLSPAETDTGAARNAVAGDREFSSKNPAMQEINPHVASISVAYVLPRR